MSKDSKIVVLDKELDLIDALVPSINSEKLLKSYFNCDKINPKKRLTDEEFLQIAESEVKRLNVYDKALEYANVNADDKNVFIYELKGFNLDYKDVCLCSNSKYSNKYQITYVIFKEKTLALSINVIDLLYNCSTFTTKEYSYKDVLSISLISDYKEIYKGICSKEKGKKIKAKKTEINAFSVEFAFVDSTVKLPIFLGETTIATLNEIKNRFFERKI